MKLHRWIKPYTNLATFECINCNTVRMVIAWNKKGLPVRRYIQPDGKVKTGHATKCNPDLKKIGRPMDLVLHERIEVLSLIIPAEEARKELTKETYAKS